MKFELYIALRYLKAKRKQTLISVISLISILGVTAGVMALVIALALSAGFREDIQTKIVGATSYINLLRLDGAPLTEYRDLTTRLRTVPHVTGVAPAIFSQVFILGPTHNQGAELKGVDPEHEREIADFFSHIIEGDPHALDSSPDNAPSDAEAPLPPPANAIIGKEMARSLGVRVGDTIRAVFPRGSLTPFGLSVSSKPFRVAAIFSSGLWDFDANWIYTNLQAAARTLSYPAGAATVLQFKTDDIEQVASVAEQIRNTAGQAYFTSTWIDLNKPLFSALKLERIVLFVTIGLIVFVASLNIVTTLIMMVLEKQADIAILSAMGATQKVIMGVFMLQGLIIGLIGTAMGAILGVCASRILDAYRLIRLEAEVYSIPYVPFHVKTWDVILVCGTALLISFVATLYPARSASRLDPVEVLRHE